MRELFVVCTKEDEYIFKCVENINRTHPNADILIVDSDSDNKDYMQTISNDKRYKNVIVSNFKNKNYEFGSILHGFLNYKNKYDIFFFIQDSIIINEKIDLHQMDERSALVFYDCKHGWINWREARDTAKQQYPDFFNHPTYVSANKNFNVQYNSFIIYSSAFNKCIDSEIFSLVGPPKNKIGSINWERLWTSVLLANNIEIKLLKNAEKYITKIFGDRK
tara:strand:+ start:421 stop:1080 length:660 start_codon:yes stop_codon:yes gene_type:complete